MGKDYYCCGEFSETCRDIPITFLCSIQTAAHSATLPLTAPDFLPPGVCFPATVLLPHAQVILYMVLLSHRSPVEAAASPDICDKYTGADNRAACQQLYTGRFSNLVLAAGGDKPAAAIGTAAHATRAPWQISTPGGRSLKQQDSAEPAVSGNGELVENIATASSYKHHRHRSREDGYDKQPEQREPWYYHGHEHIEPSSGESEGDPYPHKHRAIEDSGTEPYIDQKEETIYSAPHHHTYPPPAPSIPLFSSSTVVANVVVTPFVGKGNATGELTADDFESWRE